MSKLFDFGKKILHTLQDAGYEAYFVGGYVRDYLLDRPSNDIDITTSATPTQVINLFDKVIETGVQYGTVTVFIDNFGFEVTTFRSDGEYMDKRRPSDVTFSSTVKEDISRRDFTMNALLMNYDEEIIDYVGGKTDINQEIIRTIKDPNTRFKEDALRILRAVRFVSKLGFTIEKHTVDAIKQLNSSIQDIAIERVMVELKGIFEGEYRNKALNYLFETNVVAYLYGLKKGLNILRNIDKPVNALEAYIICFLQTPMSDVWKFSNHNQRIMKKVMMLHEVTKEDEFNAYLVFSYKLDICLITNRINVLLGYEDQSNLIKKLHQEMPIHDVCDLAFKGEDIISLTNLKKGRWIGQIIDQLLYQVIMKKLPNEYETLKAFALDEIEKLLKEKGDING